MRNGPYNIICRHHAIDWLIHRMFLRWQVSALGTPARFKWHSPLAGFFIGLSAYFFGIFAVKLDED